MEIQSLLPHHKHLLETGDIPIPHIVLKASDWECEGFWAACPLFAFYCSTAYNLQSLTIPFSVDKYMEIAKCSRNIVLKANDALLKYNCIEFTKGTDKRMKYLKILV